MDPAPGPGQYIQIQDWSASNLKDKYRGSKQANSKFHHKIG